MRNKKKFAIISVMLCLIFAACVSVAAATGTAVSDSSSSAKRNSNDGAKCRGTKCGYGVMKQLSELTGISVGDLHAKYPQKTSWQIALQLGKLDALKIAVLANHKKMFERLVKDGKITNDYSVKMYAEFQKRVSAIDGKNTVILGKLFLPAKTAYMP